MMPSFLYPDVYMMYPHNHTFLYFMVHHARIRGAVPFLYIEIFSKNLFRVPCTSPRVLFRLMTLITKVIAMMICFTHALYAMTSHVARHHCDHLAPRSISHVALQAFSFESFQGVVEAHVTVQQSSIQYVGTVLQVSGEGVRISFLDCNITDYVEFWPPNVA
jgi:hypothetical protein